MSYEKSLVYFNLHIEHSYLLGKAFFVGVVYLMKLPLFLNNSYVKNFPYAILLEECFHILLDNVVHLQ